LPYQAPPRKPAPQQLAGRGMDHIDYQSILLVVAVIITQVEADAAETAVPAPADPDSNTDAAAIALDSILNSVAIGHQIVGPGCKPGMAFGLKLSFHRGTEAGIKAAKLAAGS
jgi:hypothetical protein